MNDPHSDAKQAPSRFNWLPWLAVFLVAAILVVNYAWPIYREHRAVVELRGAGVGIAGDVRIPQWLWSKLGDDWHKPTAGYGISVRTNQNLRLVAEFIPNLERLSLKYSSIDDSGLSHLARHPTLKVLRLDYTYAAIGDDGMRHLRQVKTLEWLFLNRTSVGDAGLAHLSGLTNLTKLHLGHTPVTDNGLRHLKGLQNLQKLDLSGLPITDEGLMHLSGLTSLEHLVIKHSQVTFAGCVRLQKAKQGQPLDIREH